MLFGISAMNSEPPKKSKGHDSSTDKIAHAFKSNTQRRKIHEKNDYLKRYFNEILQSKNK